MNVLIIEDEVLATKRLEKLLLGSSRKIDVVGKLDTVKGAVKWLSSSKPPDLIFMDIQLADGLSFDIFDLVDVDCPVIFTTAYDQYAIRAFKVNSIDYILKPLDAGELYSAINKFEFLTGNYSQKTSPEAMALQQAIEMLQQKNYKERFVVKIGEHIRSVSVDEINFFSSEDKVTFANTNDKRRYVLDYTLDYLTDMIDPKTFFRINRKYIVSMQGIEDIISYSTHRLKIQLKNCDTMDAIVSRERVNDFKRWLDQ